MNTKTKEDSLRTTAVFQFINKHIFWVLIASTFVAWVCYATLDRIIWYNNPSTVWQGYCGREIAAKAGIFCPRGTGLDFRITNTGRAFYRTPPLMPWPFYHQGESPELIPVLESLFPEHKTR